MGALRHPRVAEFFAGIGLVRMALESAQFRIVFANDVDPIKRTMYETNFGGDHFVPGDVRDIRADDVPDVELATASFPCTDLSLAGYRAGFSGEHSSLFWEFTRILGEMGEARRPAVALLENVPSFASSHGGEDLRLAVGALNELGYSCDLLVVDARRFVPQSRPRLFIVAAAEPPPYVDEWDGEVRPSWVFRFLVSHPELRLHAMPLRIPPSRVRTLAEVTERVSPRDARWWGAERLESFVESLSDLQWSRVEEMRDGRRLQWATAYRRTRHGRAVWEVRNDDISGCLRTARGGSSRQAVVEAGRGNVRVRWMTPREYARLQGAPEYDFDAVSESQARFGFGDAVCVPVVEWLAKSYLHPLVAQQQSRAVA